VAFVARLDGTQTHEAITRALAALENLEHRGAAGADAETGDGAGILVQMPDTFLRSVSGISLPPLGAYGVAVCFLPQERARRLELERLLEEVVAVEGQTVLGWRDVPVDNRHVGSQALLFAPCIRQLFVAASPELAGDPAVFERRLYVIRRVAERAAGAELALPSFSARTLVYKGMLTAPQLGRFFPDLADERLASALALVHSRFSTNTFPSWELAHPYRMVAHNGEINTLRGNVNWMRARESPTRLGALRRRHREGAAGRPVRRLRHRGLRQRARAARPRGSLAAARADDDGAGGIRRAFGCVGRAARVLCLPRVPD